jgi:hypothetical protein
MCCDKLPLPLELALLTQNFDAVKHLPTHQTRYSKVMTQIHDATTRWNSTMLWEYPTNVRLKRLPFSEWSWQYSSISDDGKKRPSIDEVLQRRKV